MKSQKTASSSEIRVVEMAPVASSDSGEGNTCEFVRGRVSDGVVEMTFLGELEHDGRAAIYWMAPEEGILLGGPQGEVFPVEHAVVGLDNSGVRAWFEQGYPLRARGPDKDYTAQLWALLDKFDGWLKEQKMFKRERVIAQAKLLIKREKAKAEAEAGLLENLDKTSLGVLMASKDKNLREVGIKYLGKGQESPKTSAGQRPKRV